MLPLRNPRPTCAEKNLREASVKTTIFCSHAHAQNPMQNLPTTLKFQRKHFRILLYVASIRNLRDT